MIMQEFRRKRSFLTGMARGRGLWRRTYPRCALKHEFSVNRAG